MADSIQTDNRSALQAAIELGVDQLLGRLEAAAPLPTLFDALQTPEAFLVSLAIERGIVDWSEDDSERARRMTTRDAMSLHRLSCSRLGIRRSIQALGFDAHVYRVRPYVFAVEAELESEALTDVLLQRILRRVNTYRAGRDSIELALARSAAAPYYIGVLAATAIISESEAYRPDVNESMAGPRMGVLAETYIISNSEAAR